MADEEEKGREDALADVKLEGSEEEPAKEEEKTEEKTEEKETPKESPPEETKTEEPPASEGGEEQPQENIQSEQKLAPFTDDPRFIRRMQSLKEKADEFDDRLAELDEKEDKARIEREQVQQSSEPMPNWFQETYGDNPQAWQGFKDYSQAQRQQLKQEIQQEQQQQTQVQQQEQKQLVEYFDNEIQYLRDEGKNFDENKLRKVIVDYQPFDNRGVLDVQRGYKIYQALEEKANVVKVQENVEKKEVASATMDEGKGEAKKRDYRTPNDFKGIGWDEELDNI